MKYDHLGYANSWEARIRIMPDGSKKIDKPDTTPQAYKKCITAHHVHREVKKGDCWYAVYCDTCGISWEYDFSG